MRRDPVALEQLRAYLATSEIPRERACDHCRWACHVAAVAGDEHRVLFTACQSPERETPAVVYAMPARGLSGAHSSAEIVDELVLRAIARGERAVQEIARVAAVSDRTVWKAVRRLKDAGELPESLGLSR